MEDQVLASYARARTNNAGRKIVAVRFSPCCRRVRVRTACGAARAPCGGGLARAAGASSQRMRSARHRAAPRDARPASAPSPASITVARVVPSVATSSSRWWRCGHSRSACEQTTNKLTPRNYRHAGAKSPYHQGIGRSPSSTLRTCILHLFTNLVQER